MIIVRNLPGLFLYAIVSEARNQTSPVTLRQCVNFQSSYAGSWLARFDPLVKETTFEDKQALEFATRNLFNRARGKKGSGWKSVLPVSDFVVMHLSGIEHAFVRRQGYSKGLAMTQKISDMAFTEVIDAGHLAKRRSPSSDLDFAERTVAVVPFFSGSALVNVTKDARGHEHLEHISTRGSGGANTHTLAPRELKYFQLAIVVASIAEYINVIVVGVVDAEEKNATEASLKRYLAPALTTRNRLRVVNVHSAGHGAYLPYRLLRWVQEQNNAGRGRFGINEDLGTVDKENGSPHQNHHHHHHPRHHSQHQQQSKYSKTHEINRHSMGASALRNVSNIPGDGSDLHLGGPFEFVYYSEADNLLRLGVPSGAIAPDKNDGVAQQQPSRSAGLEAAHYRSRSVARSLVAFLRSDTGRSSYVAPQVNCAFLSMICCVVLLDSGLIATSIVFLNYAHET